MWIGTAKFVFACIWLFAICRLGCGQDIANDDKTTTRCLTPPQPENGQWNLHPTLCEDSLENDNMGCRVPAGVELEIGSSLVYGCNTGYRVQGSSEVYCGRGGRWSSLPLCVVCGRTITRRQSLIGDGVATKEADLPWHASVYREVNTANGPRKDFQCGATIIQANLLLTAAHCVYDEGVQAPLDPGKLFVMTGNTHLDYASALHDPSIVRKSAVKNVYVRCNYYGLRGNYASDIALLRLTESFQLTSILLPACLNFADDSSQIPLDGAFGKISVSGRSSTIPTNGMLQTITVPHISHNQCRKDAGKNGVFITSDKFCGGHTNGTAVCTGDSGSGLVFRKDELWYVLGVASVGLRDDRGDGGKLCDEHSFTLYTRVSHHMSWIQEVILELERHGSYPSCGGSS